MAVPLDLGKYSFNTKTCLGQGQFGKVFLGRDKHTQEEVAIKEIRLRGTQSYEYLQVLREIDIMRRVSHKHILRCLDVVDKSDAVYLVTEYCDDDLSALIYKHRVCEQNPKRALELLAQIISGYQVLYQQHIIHRDLKPNNILSKAGQVKIADFGFAKHIMEDCGNSTVGTPYYMAPQLMYGHPYSAKCDVYSLGVIFYEMCYSALPFPSSSREQLLSQMQQPLNLPEPDSRLEKKQQALVVHILRGCLQQQEAARLSWEDLFRLKDQLHPSQGIRLSQSSKSSFAQNVSEMKDLEDQRVSLNNQQFMIAEIEMHKDLLSSISLGQATRRLLILLSTRLYLLSDKCKLSFPDKHKDTSSYRSFLQDNLWHREAQGTLLQNLGATPPSCSDLQKKSKQSLIEFISQLSQHLSCQDAPCFPNEHRRLRRLCVVLHYANLMYFYVIAPDNTLQSPDLSHHTRLELMVVLLQVTQASRNILAINQN